MLEDWESLRPETEGREVYRHSATFTVPGEKIDGWEKKKEVCEQLSLAEKYLFTWMENKCEKDELKAIKKHYDYQVINSGNEIVAGVAISFIGSKIECRP